MLSIKIPSETVKVPRKIHTLDLRKSMVTPLFSPDFKQGEPNELFYSFHVPRDLV